MFVQRDKGTTVVDVTIPILFTIAMLLVASLHDNHGLAIVPLAIAAALVALALWRGAAFGLFVAFAKRGDATHVSLMLSFNPKE
jgi:hypothetical protein